MQKLHEKLLIFRVSEGKDRRAFGVLYDLYFERIRRYILFKMESREDAEDLTSQTFLKIWEYLTNPENRRVQEFQAFVYRLARNLIVDFYRKQGRTPEIITFEEQKEEGEIPDYRQDFLLTQLYKSDRAYLADCLKKLKEEYREVIVLRFLEDMEVGEIAKIVEKNPGNVRVLIHRGLKALREVYDRKGTDQTT